MKILKLLSLSAILLLNGCQKDKKTEPDIKPTPYYVQLTDAPGPYLAVNIDLQAVEVTGPDGGVTLNTVAGIYNLLDFADGTDTLIATGSLNQGKVSQIRLILGNNNTIVTADSVVHSLKTPSAQQSGLKIQVHQELEAGVAYYVLLDFDAAQSIVEQGNGDFLLKPVIRSVETALSGSIKGKISPAGVFATVTASSGGNTYSGFVNANGEFIISGLPPGTYTVTVTPASPYSSVTIPGVNVTTGSTTNVGVASI